MEEADARTAPLSYIPCKLSYPGRYMYIYLVGMDSRVLYPRTYSLRGKDNARKTT